MGIIMLWLLKPDTGCYTLFPWQGWLADHALLHSADSVSNLTSRRIGERLHQICCPDRVKRRQVFRDAGRPTTFTA